VVIDHSAASLDVTILTTFNGVSDILAFEAPPALGEDALDFAPLSSALGP